MTVHVHKYSGTTITLGIEQGFNRSTETAFVRGYFVHEVFIWDLGVPIP